MTSRYVFLGFPLSRDAPSPPAIPAIEMSPFLTIDKDGANVTMLKFTSHTGTHLDTPMHVVKGGLSLTDFEAKDFIFDRPAVLDLPLEDATVVQPRHLEPFVDQAKDADLLLFRFGYGAVRRTDPARFSLMSPGFGVEGARFLRDNCPTMRALGMDVPSVACIEYLDVTMAAHNVLLEGVGRRFLIIEDMNLDQDLSGLKRVVVAPLWVKDIDGGPCTVFGEIA